MGLLATDMVYEYVLDRRTSGSRSSTRPRSRRRSRSSRSRRAAQLAEDGIPEDRIVDPARRRLPLPRPGLRAAGRLRRRGDRRRLGREGPRGLPRHPRARVLAPLRGVGHRDPEHPRARHRPAAEARRRPRSRPGAESPDGGAPPRGRRLVPRRRQPRRRCRRASTTARRSRPGNVLEGPAIVNQYDSTTVIPPGLAAQVDRFGNIVIAIGAAAASRAAETRQTEVAAMSVAEYEVGRQPGPADAASASRSTRSRCACSAAPSTRSPRRWPACSSG